MVVSASFIMGFRYQPAVPLANLWFNLALYAAFAAIHIVMTTPAFKRTVYGSAAGTPTERRVYITTTIVTWVGLYWLHKPIGGFGFESPAWLQYLGLCTMLLSQVELLRVCHLRNARQHGRRARCSARLFRRQRDAAA